MTEKRHIKRTDRKSICLFGLAIVCALSGQLLAQQPQDKSDKPDLPETEVDSLESCESCGSQTIVISASRTEQEQFTVDRSVDLVGRKKLEELQVRSLPEAVDEVTGVYLQQTNRGSGSPFIRGLVGPQNLILVDGVRFNTSTLRTGPNQYLALIDPFALSRIEIVRGPSSVLYGNGAMGGVIHAISLDPKKTSESFSLGGRAMARMSTADYTRAGTIQLAPATGDLALLVGGSVNSYDTLRAGGGADQPISDYFTGYWHLKAKYAPESKWSLTGAYFGATLRDSGRADQAAKADLRFYDNDDHLAYLRFHWNGEDTFRRVQATLAFHRVSEQINRFGCVKNEFGLVDDLGACFELAEDQIVRKRSYNDVVNVIGGDANVGMDFWSRRIRLNAGLEVYQEFISSELHNASEANGFQLEKQARGNYSDGSEYRSLGLFLHGNATIWDFGTEIGSLCLTGGTRFSNFSAFAPDVPDIGDVNYTYNGVVGSAGVQFLRRGVFNVYASFIQGFRAPNLQETTVVGDTGQKFNIPNPDLKPEQSNTVEIGTKLNIGPIEASLAIYYSVIEDVIVWQSTTYNGQTEIEGKSVVHLVNSSAGIYQGVEASVAAHYWRFTLFGSLTWTQGDIEMP
ncbi:MAG: TonB-dependent receptor, partial [Deltaproteobacteria bacterium]|nr:TonB-dependent receptor [Deltaproteobacteria bacterium]